MSYGYREDTISASGQQILGKEHVLPEGVEVISTLDAGGWTTQVTFAGVSVINGTVMQSVYHDGVLSLSVNDRRMNTVYRFDQNGGQMVNNLSRALTQESDVSLFLCATHPERLYLHHAYLGRTLPVIGQVTQVQQHFEVAFAMLFEHIRIDCESGQVAQKTGVCEYYRVLVDPANALSTLIRQSGTQSEVLSVTDLATGKRIYARRAFSEQSVAAALARHSARSGSSGPHRVQSG
ncbi:MAG: hypothetical protein ACERKO_11500 [Acetanaerobacterium sp.]